MMKEGDSMAFWAMAKHEWFKRDIPDMISMFKKKLYDEWYNSLTPDEQMRLENEHKAKVKNLLLMANMMNAMIPDHYRR